MPGAQAAQAELLTADAYVPGAQATQAATELCIGAALAKPAPQGAMRLPPAHHEPTGQGTHAPARHAECATSAQVPYGQARQVDAQPAGEGQ